MLNIFVIILSLYLAIVGIVYVIQGAFVYFPSSEQHGSPQDMGLVYEDVYFTSKDGARLHGWYIPSLNTSKVILFCHGNAGNITDRLESIDLFHKMGFSVFIFDYQGYGESGGEPTELGTYFDAEAAWQYLTDERQVNRDNIIVFGRSLGGSIAAKLGTKVKPHAIILESTFTSAPDMARQSFPLLPARLLCKFRYSTIDYVKSLRAPVLIIHSQTDELIPFLHGKVLYKETLGQKQFLRIQGSHNTGFLESKEVYIKGIRHFLSLLDS